MRRLAAVGKIAADESVYADYAGLASDVHIVGKVFWTVRRVWPASARRGCSGVESLTPASSTSSMTDAMLKIGSAESSGPD